MKSTIRKVAVCWVALSGVMSVPLTPVFASHPSGTARTAQRRPSAQPARTPAATLKALLDASGLDYTVGQQGTYKVVVSYEGETTLIYSSETRVGSGTDPQSKLVSLYYPLVMVPEKFKHPAALLKKLAEINDRLVIGRLSISGEEGHVWYSSSFWLATANSDVLLREMYIAHFLRSQLRKELLPFVQE